MSLFGGPAEQLSLLYLWRVAAAVSAAVSSGERTPLACPFRLPAETILPSYFLSTVTRRKVAGIDVPS